MKTMQLDIVTPERTIYSAPAYMVIARAVTGDIGIMPGHMPLVATLTPWSLRIKKDETQEEKIVVSGGFLEVNQDKVTVLARTAEFPQDIDKGRAQAAKERAEMRLKSADEKIDHARAQAALNRALARLQALQS